MQADLRVDASRLAASIDELARIGAVEGGGVCRTAASGEDRRARDLVVSWMRAAGLDVKIDAVGNVRIQAPCRIPSGTEKARWRESDRL